MIKWGLVGLGKAGREHLNVLSEIAGIKVTAICDINEDYLKKQGNLYDIKNRYTDYRHLLAQPEIKAVSVITGDDMHYPVVIEAAKAKKHVLCEKPLAPSAKEGKEMVKAMEKANCLLAVSFNYRQDKVYLKMKEFIKDGIIGKVRVIRLIHLGQAPDLMVIRSGYPAQAAQARINHMMKVGGPIFDCGVHSFDIARILADSDYKRIEARGCNIRGFTYPDHTVAICEHKNGIMSIIENTYTYAFKAKEYKEYVRRDIIGSKGTITYDLEKQVLEVYHPGGTIREKISYPSHNDDRRGIYKEFIASIKEGKLRPTIASGEDGVKATEAALTAVKSQMEKVISR